MINGKAMMLQMIIFALLFAPHAIYVLGGFDSLAIGLVISSSLVSGSIILYKNKLELSRRSWECILLTVSLLSVYSALSFSMSYNSKIISIIPLILLIMQAAIVGEFLAGCNNDILLKIFFRFTLVCIVIGWMGVFQLGKYGPYAIFPKSIFPFREYSHFGLVVGLSLLVITSQINHWRYLFCISNIILIGLFLPNFTVIIFCAISLIKNIFNSGRRYLHLVVLFCFSVFAVLPGMVDLDYFSDRVQNIRGDNTTTLVWLQGVEILYQNIIATFGLGIGFQGLGIHGISRTGSSDLIYLAAGADLNLDDGGFLAAKIISEFGILGICVVCYISYFSLRWVVRPTIDLQKTQKYQIVMKKLNILECFVAALIVELLFRGLGYFSPGIYFAFVGCFALCKTKGEYDNI